MNNEITKNIERLINSKLDSSDSLRAMAKRIREGRGTYKDLYAYSNAMSKAIKESAKSELIEAFGTGKIKGFENLIGTEIMRSVFTDYHGKLIDLGSAKVNAQLKSLSLGIKPIKTDVTFSRLLDVMRPLDEAVTVEEVTAFLDGEKINQFYNASLDEFIEENANFQYEAGLMTVIVRSCGSEACEFCSNLAGVYEYNGTKEAGPHENIFARHDGCTCTIDVRTTRGGGFTRTNNYKRRK